MAEWRWLNEPKLTQLPILLEVPRGTPVQVQSPTLNIRPVAPPRRRVGETEILEFVLAQPGKYEMQVGVEKVSFEVARPTNMGFGMEFGLTAALILTGLGSLIWKYRKRSTS